MNAGWLPPGNKGVIGPGGLHLRTQGNKESRHQAMKAGGVYVSEQGFKDAVL